MAVVARKEIKIAIIQAHQPLAFFDSRQQLIGRHILVDDPPQLAVADIGIEHDAADLPEQKHLFVGGFGNRQAELIQFSRPR